MDKLISVTLGPFFTPTNSNRVVDDPIVPLNLAIEWASAKEAKRILLFRHRPLRCPNRVRLEHIVFHRSDLPCDMDCQQYQVIETPVGDFLPLDALLAALYRDYKITRSLRDLLNELVALVPVHSATTNQIRTERLLTPKAEALGFRLNSLYQESELICAQLAWEPKNQSARFHVCLVNFKQGAGLKLDEGTLVPHREIGISEILADELHRLIPGSPLNLLTDRGLQFLTAPFPPTPPANTKTAPYENVHERTVER